MPTPPKRPNRPPPPKDETKAQRFSRVAQQRVNKAAKQIELIGTLAGSRYESKPEQVRQIAMYLRGKVDMVASRFEKSAASAEPEFKV